MDGLAFQPVTTIWGHSPHDTTGTAAGSTPDFPGQCNNAIAETIDSLTGNAALPASSVLRGTPVVPDRAMRRLVCGQGRAGLPSARQPMTTPFSSRTVRCG